MALINCPECNSNISDKAHSCPHCGCPITTDAHPDLPDDLSIGHGFDLEGETVLMVGKILVDSRNKLAGSGSVQIKSKGILFSGEAGVTRAIHRDLILSFDSGMQADIVHKKKSVIGRAVAGGLLLGPVGAVVGGLSGMAGREQSKNEYCLVLDYWDCETEGRQSILFASKYGVGNVNKFIRTLEKFKSGSLDRHIAKAGPSSEYSLTATIAILFILILVVSVLISKCG